jgi:hypothetical protein
MTEMNRSTDERSAKCDQCAAAPVPAPLLGTLNSDQDYDAEVLEVLRAARAACPELAGRVDAAEVALGRYGATMYGAGARDRDILFANFSKRPAELEKFKAWAGTCDGNCSRLDLLETPADSSARQVDGQTFVNAHVDRDWTVWTARAALELAVATIAHSIGQPPLPIASAVVPTAANCAALHGEAVDRWCLHCSIQRPDACALSHSPPHARAQADPLADRGAAARDTFGADVDDARRFRLAISESDHAETLYATVLSHSPDLGAVRREFDAAMAEISPAVR